MFKFSNILPQIGQKRKGTKIGNLIRYTRALIRNLLPSQGFSLDYGHGLLRFVVGLLVVGGSEPFTLRVLFFLIDSRRRYPYVARFIWQLRFAWFIGVADLAVVVSLR